MEVDSQGGQGNSADQEIEVDIFGAIDESTPAVVTPDAKSIKEERDFEKAVRSEIQRLVIYALRLGAIILGGLLLVRFWHLGSPTGWRWLTDMEVQSIDKMLFSSAFGGFVFSYLKDSIFKGQK